MEVRLATANDLDALFSLNELFENTTSKPIMKKSLEENINEVISIAFIDEVAVGYATAIIIKSICYIDNRVDIETLFVKEEYRKQGVGAALMQCLESEIISRGIFHFHLTTHRDNVKAQSLYKKMGYEDTGELLLHKTIKLRS